MQIKNFELYRVGGTIENNCGIFCFGGGLSSIATGKFLRVILNKTIVTWFKTF
jgi:hypothetical protein